MKWRYKLFVTAVILILLMLAVAYWYIPGHEEGGKKPSIETTSEVKKTKVKDKTMEVKGDVIENQGKAEAPSNESSEEPSEETLYDEQEESQKKEDSIEGTNAGKDTVAKYMTGTSQAAEVQTEEDEPSKDEESNSNEEKSGVEVKVKNEDAEMEKSVSVPEEKKIEQNVTIQVPIYEEETVYWIKDDLGSVIYKSIDPKEWESKILYYAENAVKTTYGQNGVEIVAGHKEPATIPLSVWENSGWYGNEDVIVTYN